MSRIADLLDSATVGGGSNKIQGLIDDGILTAKDWEAIIAARRRGIGHGRIAEIVTAGLKQNGHDIVVGDTAVRSWLASQDVK